MVLHRIRNLILVLSIGGTCLAQPSIKLGWDQSITPNTTVNVYRLTGRCTGTFFEVAGNVSGVGPWTDTTVAYGTNYCYYLRAVGVNGTSAASAKAWFMIPKLSATKTCTVAAGGNTIKVTATLTTPDSITITCQ